MLEKGSVLLPTFMKESKMIVQVLLNKFKDVVKIKKEPLPMGWSYPVQTGDLIKPLHEAGILEQKTSIWYRNTFDRDFDISRMIFHIAYTGPQQLPDRSRVIVSVSPISSIYRKATRQLLMESVIPELTNWLKSKFENIMFSQAYCRVNYNYWYKGKNCLGEKSGFLEAQDILSKEIIGRWDHTMEIGKPRSWEEINDQSVADKSSEKVDA